MSRYTRLVLSLACIALCGILAFAIIGSSVAQAASALVAQGEEKSFERAKETKSDPGKDKEPSELFNCSAAYGIQFLRKPQREFLFAACHEGPTSSKGAYLTFFRIISSPGWHSAILARAMEKHTDAKFTVWDSGKNNPPPLAQIQDRLDSASNLLEEGERCEELLGSEAMREFLMAVSADERPSGTPFNSDYSECLGIPAGEMANYRLLTIRADGVAQLSVLVATRDFVHLQRLSEDQALKVDGQMLFVVAAPLASRVAVVGIHKNDPLPKLWQVVVRRNETVWIRSPSRSCLDLLSTVSSSARVYVDGVYLGPSPIELASASVHDEDDAYQIERILWLARGTGESNSPDHEVLVLEFEPGEWPSIRYRSAIRADDLEKEGQCRTLRLDLSPPVEKRVAILNFDKLEGCEGSPLWPLDISERARQVLGRDPAHARERSLVDYLSYIQASEVLNDLAGRVPVSPENHEDGGDPGSGTVLRSLARQAWSQGIDTLLLFSLQCTRRQSGGGEVHWAYRLRVKAIRVSEIYERGYHDRGGIELKDFVKNEAISFESDMEVDSSVGILLDLVFQVSRPRLGYVTTKADFRSPRTIRFGQFESEELYWRENRLKYVQMKYGRLKWRGGTLRKRGSAPPLCEELAYRGARSSDAIDSAVDIYLASKVRRTSSSRIVDDAALSSGVYRSEVSPTRPGWYLVVAGDEPGQRDAVCIRATVPRVSFWGDFGAAGAPVGVSRPYASGYFRTRLGFTRYGPNGWGGVGASLGHGLTSHNVDIDESFRDLDWHRHGLLLAPHGEFRVREVAPVTFGLRIGAALDIGIYDLNELSPEIARPEGIDPDISLSFDFLVGRALGPVDLQVMMMYTYASVNDGTVSTSVVENGSTFIGLGMSLSGATREGRADRR